MGGAAPALYGLRGPRRGFRHQRRGALMPIDRKKLLEGRLRAKALLAHPDQEIRNLAKKALDHAEVALGMDDARLRAVNKQTKAND